MKSFRHNKILELINEKSIDTQEELQKALLDEGYNVTQATISRDIKELQLIKIMTSEGKYKYKADSKPVAGKKDNFTALFQGSVLSINDAQNIIVVKTASGMAQAVCAAIDAMRCDPVLGTIAGDDTIFIAAKTSYMAKKVVSSLKGLLLSPN